MNTFEKGVVFSPANTVEYAEGSVVSREILRNNAGTLTLFAFDAGQGLSEHTAPFDATVTILDGEAEITVGGVVQVRHPSPYIALCASPHHRLSVMGRFLFYFLLRGFFLFIFQQIFFCCQ